jgi:hypothetical protein
MAVTERAKKLALRVGLMIDEKNEAGNGFAVARQGCSFLPR